MTDTSRTTSRRGVLGLGAAGVAGAAVAAGIGGRAQAAPRSTRLRPYGRQTIGGGTVDNPAQGPKPSFDIVNDMTLVKNWDFGTAGTIPDIATMSTEFQYHDQFNTFNNGNGNYGANTVAPSAALALSGQPIEDPNNPVRAFLRDSLQTYLVPPADALTVKASDRNVGCGSFVAKSVLPRGGALLKQSMLWETRLRFNPPPYYFAGIWAAGNIWDTGAEMDVFETFGFDNGGGLTNFHGEYWHSNSVGGSDTDGYGNWITSMGSHGITGYDASKYHVWQWLYNADDTYHVFNDGKEVQHGVIHWTDGGGVNGTPIDMTLLFDGAWGHTQISTVNLPLPALEVRHNQPITNPDAAAVPRPGPDSDLAGKFYEWDYSRVYLSDPVS